MGSYKACLKTRDAAGISSSGDWALTWDKWTCRAEQWCFWTKKKVLPSRYSFLGQKRLNLVKVDPWMVIGGLEGLKGWILGLLNQKESLFQQVFLTQQRLVLVKVEPSIDIYFAFSWNLQGVPKKMRLLFCLISRQPNIRFSNCFFLLKTEIHTLVLNTQTFLSNFWGLRYLRNKMGFLIRWFWSKLKLFDLELPHIKQMKSVIISIQSVWVIMPTRSHLGSYLGGAWHKFCSFEATMRQCKYELICYRTAFCFVNISTP